MELKDAIAILKEHNKWRRGEPPYDEVGERMPYSPEDIGTAIDSVVDHFSEAVVLTWRDVRKIVTIADDIADFDTYRNRHTGEEAYCTEVLKKFKEDGICGNQ